MAAFISVTSNFSKYKSSVLSYVLGVVSAITASLSPIPLISVLKLLRLIILIQICSVIVTRYFGGILLGAGGLVRAYSDSVAQVLKKCEFYDIKKVVKFSFTTSY